MWFFTRHGFYSIVTSGPGFVVRSRDPEHLRRLQDHVRDKGPARHPGVKAFVTAPIVELPNRDYRWRIPVDCREVLQLIVASVVADLNYGNFKSAVHSEDLESFEWELYADSLHTVWASMHNLQQAVVSRQSRVKPAPGASDGKQPRTKTKARTTGGG